MTSLSMSQSNWSDQAWRDMSTAALSPELEKIRMGSNADRF